MNERQLTTTTPPLENGDRLNRHEFERRYDATPHLKQRSTVVVTADAIALCDRMKMKLITEASSSSLLPHQITCPFNQLTHYSSKLVARV